MTKAPPQRKDYFFHHAMTSRWRDNDAYGHVNNAVFYEYVDTVVNHWLIVEAGLSVPGSNMIGLVVRSECDFFGPLAFPGRIDGGMALARIGTSSVTYDVGLFAENREEAAARALFTHVYVDAKERRPKPLPDWFRARLQALTPAGAGAAGD